MRIKRVLTIDGEKFELEASSARRLIERLVVVTHRSGPVGASYQVLNELLSSGQLTACERHLVRSFESIRADHTH